MITEIIDSIDINNVFIDLIDYEKSIYEKIIKGLPLTYDEYFFITYFVSPTKMIKSIWGIINEKSTDSK